MIEYDLAILPCSARKDPYGTTALSLYKSGRTLMILKHARQRARGFIFMSAKYGLLRPDDPVSNYDEFLGAFTGPQRDALAQVIREQIKAGILGDGGRILSYVPIDYLRLLLTADPGVIRAPYLGLALFDFNKVISNETKNHARGYPSRRSRPFMR